MTVFRSPRLLTLAVLIGTAAASAQGSSILSQRICVYRPGQTTELAPVPADACSDSPKGSWSGYRCINSSTDC